MDKFAVMIAKDKRRDGLAHGRCVTEGMFDVLLEMARENKCPIVLSMILTTSAFCAIILM